MDHSFLAHAIMHYSQTNRLQHPNGAYRCIILVLPYFSVLCCLIATLVYWNAVTSYDCIAQIPDSVVPYVLRVLSCASLGYCIIALA